MHTARRNRASSAEVAAYLDHFRARVLQDALNEATSAYWLRRADDVAAAIGHPTSDPRLGTPKTRAAARASLERMEAEFRRRAQIALIDGGIEDVVWDVHAETDDTGSESVDYPAA